MRCTYYIIIYHLEPYEFSMKWTLLFLLTFIARSYQTYDLVNESLVYKQRVCDQNVAFCAKSCFDVTLANKCSPSTMYFNCLCSGNDLSVSIHLFPVQVSQCFGELKDCQKKCADYNEGSAESTCSLMCKQTLQCGTSNASESKMFFTNVTQTMVSIPTSTVTLESVTSNADILFAGVNLMGVWFTVFLLVLAILYLLQR